MSKFANPESIYLIALSVIQPARIQDIEYFSNHLFAGEALEVIPPGVLRTVHETARSEGLVIPVRRGVYCVSRKGAMAIRRGRLPSLIDNRRLFLMKAERRGKIKN